MHTDILGNCFLLAEEGPHTVFTRSVEVANSETKTNISTNPSLETTNRVEHRGKEAKTCYLIF